MVDKVKSAGRRIEVLKMQIPGKGWLCYFKDPEGILFGLFHNDKSAE